MSGDQVSQNIDHAYFNSFPPGFRFFPTDEELVVHYLKNKVMNKPLPKNRIIDIEFYKYNPEQLAEKYKGCGEKEWYFFTGRDKRFRLGSRPSRTTPDGYWKATGADKPIKYKGRIVGFRRVLVFYFGELPKGNKTNWIMHEFTVDDHTRTQNCGDGDMKLDKWVLCRIYNHVRNRQREEGCDQLQLQGQGDDMDHYEYAAADTATATDHHQPLILENGANPLFDHDHDQLRLVPVQDPSHSQGASPAAMNMDYYSTATATASDDHHPFILECGANKLFDHDDQLRQVHPLIVPVEDPSHSQWVSPAAPMNMTINMGMNNQFINQLPPFPPRCRQHDQSNRSSLRPPILHPAFEYTYQEAPLLAALAEYRSRILQDPEKYLSPTPQNYNNIAPALPTTYLNPSHPPPPPPPNNILRASDSG